MLKIAEIKNLNLTGNNLDSLEVIIWNKFCEGLKETHLNSVEIHEKISTSKWNRLELSLSKDVPKCTSFAYKETDCVFFKSKLTNTKEILKEQPSLFVSSNQGR